MADEARTPVGRGIISLEHDRVLWRHARKVPPMMPGRISHNEDLAVALTIAQLHGDEILLSRRGNVAHRQWPLLHRTPQWLPEIVERDPALQQLVGFLRQELAHAQRPGIRGVIAMHVHDRRAPRGRVLGTRLRQISLRADRMIADDHTPGAHLALYEFLDVAVELGTDPRIVVPLGERRVEFAEGKAFAV